LLRSGEVDAAIKLVRRALGAATAPEAKFHYQRLLATLYSRTDRAEYLRAVARLGELARADVEEEEGVYLLHHLMAQRDASASNTGHEVEAFQRRLNSFTERFPNSKILRVGHLKENVSAAQLSQQLQMLVGLSQEQIDLQERRRRFGENAGSHLPFGYRPRTYAPFAENVADLLRICIERWYEGEASALIVADDGVLGKESKAPPIIDLVTLLALVELDLFDVLFSRWSAVAIPKESVSYLAELSLSPLSGGGIDLIDRAVRAIRRWNSKIVQPSAVGEVVRDYPHGEAVTLRQEANSGRFTYMSIDAAATVLAAMGEVQSGRFATIWPFIEHAQDAGVLTTAQASLVRLRVASWNSRLVPLRVEDVCLAALGELERGAADERSPAARAARALVSQATLADALGRAVEVMVRLVRQGAKGRAAALWFMRLIYIEAVAVRTIGFSGTADDLAACMASVCVKQVHQCLDSEVVLKASWAILNELRSTWGGTTNSDDFFKLVGVSAAELFHPIASKHGLASIEVEEDFRRLLFSLATPGTQDHERLVFAYFDRTCELNSPRQQR
jgi:hypothetical protein